MESLGVWTTSPRLPSLLHDQTQSGFFSREKEKAGKKVWTPWTSGQLPHTSLPCCVTRLNKGYSLGRRKKQGTKFGVPERRDKYPHASPPCCVTRLNQGYSLVLKKKQGTKFGVPEGRDNFPTPPLPVACPKPTRVIFSRERRSRNKLWSPWASGQPPHASLPCCMTRLNQGYSLVRRKKQ